MREDNRERRDHLKLGEIVGDCWTTFEFGVIHGVVDHDGIGRIRVVTQSVKNLVGDLCVCRSESVNSRMEGNTYLIVYIYRDISFYYYDELMKNIDGFKTSNI